MIATGSVLSAAVRLRPVPRSNVRLLIPNLRTFVTSRNVAFEPAFADPNVGPIRLKVMCRIRCVRDTAESTIWTKEAAEGRAGRASMGIDVCHERVRPNTIVSSRGPSGGLLPFEGLAPEAQHVFLRSAKALGLCTYSTVAIP